MRNYRNIVLFKSELLEYFEIFDRYMPFFKYFKKNHWRSQAILSHVNKMLDEMPPNSSCLVLLLYLQQQRLKLIEQRDCFTLSIQLTNFLCYFLEVDVNSHKNLLDYVRSMSDISKFEKELRHSTAMSGTCNGNGIVIARGQDILHRMKHEIKYMDSSDPIQERLDELFRDGSSDRCEEKKQDTPCERRIIDH